MGAFVHMGVHSHGCAVDDDVVLLDGVGRDVVVGNYAGSRVAAHEEGFQPERLQSVVDGLRRSAGAEDECLLVANFDERLYALREPYHVAVVAPEDGVVALVLHLHHVDRPDGVGLGADGVEVADYLLLVGDGDVEALELGIGVENLGQVLDAGDLEIDVLGVDAFILELLVEVVLGEGVSQRVTYESILVHTFFN